MKQKPGSDIFSVPAQYSICLPKVSGNIFVYC